MLITLNLLLRIKICKSPHHSSKSTIKWYIVTTTNNRLIHKQICKTSFCYCQTIWSPQMWVTKTWNTFSNSCHVLSLFVIFFFSFAHIYIRTFGDLENDHVAFFLILFTNKYFLGQSQCYFKIYLVYYDARLVAIKETCTKMILFLFISFMCNILNENINFYLLYL